MLSSWQRFLKQHAGCGKSIHQLAIAYKKLTGGMQSGGMLSGGRKRRKVKSRG